MSFKSCAIKIAINSTPKCIMLWAINSQLKGVADVTDLILNLDQQKIYVKVLLEEEPESIELMLEEFVIREDEQGSKLVVKQVNSNKVWLKNFITRYLLDREIKIPNKHVKLVSELLNSDEIDQEV